MSRFGTGDVHYLAVTRAPAETRCPEVLQLSDDNNTVFVRCTRERHDNAVHSVRVEHGVIALQLDWQARA